MSSKEVEALLKEREGYVRRGLKNRVKAVDEALKAYGIAVESTPTEVESASIKPEVEQAVGKRAKKRSA
jgi:hypothetical protein